MKRFLLLPLLTLLGLTAYAQSETPLFTLTYNLKDESITTQEVSFEVYVKEAGHRLRVDWGNGTLVETEEIEVNDGVAYATKLSGRILDKGVVKVYGEEVTYFDCGYAVGCPKLTDIDVTQAADLMELYVNTNALTSLDVSKNTKLTKLCCNGNPIKNLNLTSNTELTRLEAFDMDLIHGVDLLECKKLTYLSLNNNNIGQVDISACTELTDIYMLNCGLFTLDVSKNTKLKNIRIVNNQLETLDVTACTELQYLFCNGNKLTELKVGNVSKTLNCSNNFLTPATLPTKNTGTYTYAPQKALAIPTRISVEEVVDFSAMNGVKGVTEEVQTATFTWKKQDGTALVAGTDYTEMNGVFSFLKEQKDSVYCEISTAAFPNFKGNNIFKTTAAVIEPAAGVLISLVADVDGEEREFSFAGTTEGNRISIDWGDGIKQDYTETIAITDDWSSTTTLYGTPKGKGEIKIYGKDIVVFKATSYADQDPDDDISPAHIRSIDLSKATDLQELTINTNSITALDLSQNTKLTELNCYNNPISELNLAANTELVKIDAKNMKLASIDLKANTKLSDLTLSDNTISEIDLTKNTELASFYMLNNGLKSIDVSQNTKLKYLSLNNNALTSIDVSMLPALKSLFIFGNQMSAADAIKIDLAVNTSLNSINCKDNNFTLATLPALGVRTYNYQPQRAMEIPATITTDDKLDLSDQTNITGLAETAQATTFTWKTESGTALVAGTDYTETEGVFTFLKEQSEPVYCEMATAAFPKFTGANVFKTTVIKIEKGTGIDEVGANSIIVKGGEGQITVKGTANGTLVEVYSVNAQAIASKTVSNAATFNVKKGLYVVKAGGNTYKVNVR